MITSHPRIIIPILEGHTLNTDASAVRWQIADAEGAGATANQHAVQFQLEIPNQLIAEVIQRKGVPITKQQQIWDRDKVNAHVSSLNEDLLTPNATFIPTHYSVLEKEVRNVISPAINNYLKRAFGPACKTNGTTGSAIGGLINKCATFKEALERPVYITIAIIEDNNHLGMANHVMKLFQEAGCNVEDKVGVPRPVKLAQYPQKLVEVAQELNNVVYKAIGIEEGVRVAARRDTTDQGRV